MKTGGSFLTDPVVESISTREMFSDEKREIDRMVRDFARDRIAPHAEALDVHDRKLSLELLREVAELGLCGIDVPEEYGGVALDKTTSALVAEAITSGGSASWVVTFSAHVGIGTLPIVYFGTPEQKKKYLPRLASGEWLAAYALTEPQAGSDAHAVKTTTTLTEDGEAFILNGDKQYVTNGGWADLYVVFAQLDGQLSAFLVERDSPGLTVGDEEDKMGIRGSSTTSLYFDGVRVPRENLLGKPGDGLHIALNILNIGRFKLGAADLGGCKAAIDLAANYALERRQFGQPVAHFDSIRHKLADMATRTFVLDSAIYRTVGLMDERIATLGKKGERSASQIMAALEEYAIEASIGKVLGSETIARVVDQAVQIYGGYGFCEEYPLARMYRDCRIDRIFEGTNEINRMVIYGYFLKKALMEELPLREAEREWAREAEIAEPDPEPWLVESLDTIRRLAVHCLHQAICLYGQDLRNEQVVGEDLADLLIGYYGAASALNRLRQHDAAFNDRAELALARLAVAAAAEEAWQRVYRLRPVLFRDDPTGELRLALDQKIHHLHPPFDPVEEVRVLSDDLLEHGRYRF